MAWFRAIATNQLVAVPERVVTTPALQETEPRRLYRRPFTLNEPFKAWFM